MDEDALDAQNEVEVVERYEISDDEAGEFELGVAGRGGGGRREEKGKEGTGKEEKGR